MRSRIIPVSLFILVPALHAQIQLQSAFPNLSFTKPLDLQSPPDGTNRIAVVTQPGIIHIFPNSPSAVSAKVFLNIQDSVYSVGSEQGLLGLAFHPRYSENGHLFINYTAQTNARTVIARYTVSSANPDSVDKSTRLVLLEINQPYSNHNGGGLAFGPDGYLYIGTGDGGSGGDPQNRAQNNADLLGKFLRIDIDNAASGKNYAIPPDNPLVGNSSGFREEIFARGLRNPWRFSFDSTTGRLWAGDVGENAWEEIDIIEKGKNYGWRIMEGFHCYNPSTNCNQTGLTLPIWEYGHNSSGGFSVTGGYVYRGGGIPELFGKYVYADYVSRRIWFLTYDGVNPPTNEFFGTAAGGISSFGVDQNQELYLTSFDGKIYKFVKPSSTGLVEQDDPPKKFFLSQNYPNPFNPSTTVEFEHPEDEFVRLSVYNILGQEVAVLLNGEMAAGSHSVRWDGKNSSGQAVPTGVYVYRLRAGTFDQTRRMVLLR